MTRARTLFSAIAVSGATALAVAGCGGGSDSTTSTTAASTTSSAKPASGAKPTSGAALVSVSDNPDLGQILVDSRGDTLYLFEKDTGGQSACYGQCATVWPPLTTKGKPTADRGVDASLLGTTKRKDGTEEVTYNDFPLYTYQGDSKPGDTNGNNFEQFGAEWYALTPKGEKPAGS